MTYFIILTACSRKPSDRSGFEKALVGENLDYLF